MLRERMQGAVRFALLLFRLKKASTANEGLTLTPQEVKDLVENIRLLASNVKREETGNGDVQQG